MSLQGQCLCGAIVYEVTQLDDVIVHCQCRTCRKAHASAFASTARVNRKHFRWYRGDDQLRAYESSPGKVRRLCSKCGSHLVAARSGMAHVILRVATLDDDPATKPAMHIWTSHDLPWLDATEAIPRYETAPH
jgi:ADP-ribosyl-[dinitrogen reductase] hydrolase